jgi:hypothetical protein
MRRLDPADLSTARRTVGRFVPDLQDLGCGDCRRECRLFELVAGTGDELFAVFRTLDESFTRRHRSCDLSSGLLGKLFGELFYDIINFVGLALKLCRDLYNVWKGRLP